MRPVGFWRIKENQRSFLTEFAKQFGIKNNQDWGRVSTAKIKEHGGFGLLRENLTILKSLQNAFPEIKWKEDWFRASPRRDTFWKDQKNQKQLLDQISKNLRIKEPKDWGKVSIKGFQRAGGNKLLKIYDFSIRKILHKHSPDIDWNDDWFIAEKYPPSFFKHLNNQKKFMDELSKKLNIQQPSDWLSVQNRTIKEHGGYFLLLMYGLSLTRVLRNIYPGIQIGEKQKPPNYWQNRENSVKFLENFARKHSIKAPKDWGNITIEEIAAMGGRRLIQRNGSLLNTLKYYFPDVLWKKEWFLHSPKYLPSFWNRQENSQKFLDEIASQFSIRQPSDWLRVTSSLIRKKGGQGLLSKYNNSLFEILVATYQNVDWTNLHKKSGETSSPHLNVVAFSSKVFNKQET